MKPNDVSTIKKIEIECGLSAWKLEDYLFEIRRKNSITKVAVFGEEIIGYIVARPITTSINKQDNCAEVYNLAVKNDWQKKGIGNYLINDLIEICRKNKIEEILLEVRRSNKNARRFYSKRNFIEIAERKDYYTVPVEDAIIMQCSLTENFPKNENMKT